MKNTVLEKFKKGEKSLGTFNQINSTIAIECLSQTGLDYVVIDTEHTSFNCETAADLIAAAKGSGITPLVRVNDITRCNILHPLDAGAAGLVVPGLRTVEEAKKLVSYAKYFPLGERGFCPTREAGFGYAPQGNYSFEEYAKYANSQTLLLPQCETKQCLENIEEIVSMDGIDGIFVGPFDLSIALGKPCQFNDSEVVSGIKKVLDTCKKYGKIAMVFAADSTVAKSRFAEGFDSVTAGLDAGFYIEAFKKLVSEATE